MTHNIEIKVECKGSAAGTLGWFNSILEKSEFVIKNNKAGAPAIFLKTTEDDGRVKYSFLCKKWNQREDPYGYRTTDDGYLCEIPESNFDCPGFSDYPLTPACKKAVEDMISKAKAIFSEWWENDGNSHE